jgi:RNA-directed DNA polymerase
VRRGRESASDRKAPHGLPPPSLVPTNPFDLWVQHWRKHRATGEVIIVRYADDIVLGFEQRVDAVRFLQEWKERLRKFGLELHPDKTRLIEFGRFAAEDRKRRGQGKPETFNFLGSTHICAKNRKTGGFSVDRKTIRERLSAKLKAVREELRRRWHEPVAEVGKWLRSVVQGYFNYHAVPGNIDSLQSFRPKSSGTGPARYNGGARRVGCPGNVSVRLPLGGSRVL